MAQSSISVACDGCDKFVDVEELEWFDGTAYCHGCAQKAAEAIVSEFKVAPVYHPVYFLHDKDSRLLHITDDLNDAERWRTYQSENWWWFSVANIVVKFFDSPEQAKVAIARLTEKLAPRYLAAPNPEEDLDGEENPDIYSIDPNTPHKALDKVMTLRISKEMDRALTEAAVRDGSRKPHWIRSTLYDALRASAEQHHPSSTG